MVKDTVEKIQQDASDIRDVASFIYWHRENDMHGSVRREDAFSAFSRLVGIDEKRLAAIFDKDEIRG